MCPLGATITSFRVSNAAKSRASEVIEIGEAIAIVVFVIQTSVERIFRTQRGRDTIAPHKLFEGFGLSFLFAPLASTHLLLQLAGSDLAFALGRRALRRETHTRHTVALVLEVAAIARGRTFEAAGVVVGKLDSVFALATAPARDHAHHNTPPHYDPSKPTHLFVLCLLLLATKPQPTPSNRPALLEGASANQTERNERERYRTS